MKYRQRSLSILKSRKISSHVAKLFFFCVFIGLSVGEAQAADPLPCDRYFSPGGSGDGSSDMHAASIDRLNSTIREEGAGTVMCLLPGVYKTGLKITEGGTDGNPVTIRGEGGYPMFISNFDASTRERKGENAITVRASNLTIESLVFRHVGTCFRLDESVKNIHLKNFHGANVATCVDVARYKEHTVESLTISGAMILQFTRSAILIGSRATNVVIADSYLDMQPDRIGGQGSDYVTGIGLYDEASDIVIRNTTILNVRGKTTGYPQGDGIDAESTVSSVELNDSYLRGNQDGCVDSKAAKFVINNTTAIGCNRNFRLWQRNYPDGPRCDYCISYEPVGDAHVYVSGNQSLAGTMEVYSTRKVPLVVTSENGSLAIKRLLGVFHSIPLLDRSLSVERNLLNYGSSFDIPSVPNPTAFPLSVGKTSGPRLRI